MTVEDDVKKLREDFEAHRARMDNSPVGCILHIMAWLIVFLYLADPRWELGAKAVWNYLFH